MPMGDGMIGMIGDTAPDLLTPIVGYRHWKVRDGQLRSPHVAECVWDGAEKTALCIPYAGREGYQHAAPKQGCGCGLYAYFTPRDGYGVHGAVVATGRLVVHETGLRAERLQIVAFAENSEVEELPAIAKRLGVPIVPTEELELFVAEFGEPLPESILAPIRKLNEEARTDFALRSARYKARANPRLRRGGYVGNFLATARYVAKELRWMLRG